jgi:omega-6 fatty acid desaturase (delta-12 desaturase)
MFGRTEYVAVKAELNFKRSFFVMGSVLVLDACLFGIGLVLLRSPSTLAFVLSQCVFALLFFHNFCIVHECGHGSVSASRSVNLIVGHYASVLCFMPFFPWKYIHQKHHVWVGNPDRDPAGANLKRWRKEGRVPWLLRASWKTWWPLGALAQHLVFWSYPLVLAREDRSKIPQCAASVLLLPVSYLALHWLWPSVFRFSNFALAFVIYLFIEELVNLPHHFDLFRFEERLPLWDQWKAARTCYYPLFVSELLVLNFNFHVEHHLYPSLPWYRLREARKLVRERIGSGYNEAVGIGWNLKNRSRDVQELLLTE